MKANQFTPSIWVRGYIGTGEKKTNDLPQVTSAPHHEQDSNSQV
jgi:hypothetical protein